MSINYDTLAVEVANTLLEGKLSLRQVANLYGLKFEDVEVIWEELLEQFKEEDYDGNGDYDDSRD
jgi:hypothetical protein